MSLDDITSKYKVTYTDGYGNSHSKVERRVDIGKIIPILIVILIFVTFIPALALAPLFFYILYPFKKLKEANPSYECDLLKKYGFNNLRAFYNSVKLKTYITIAIFVLAIIYINYLSFSSGAKLFDSPSIITFQLKYSVYLFGFYLFVPFLFNKDRIIVKQLEKEKMNFLEKSNIISSTILFVISYALSIFIVAPLIFVESGFISEYYSMIANDLSTFIEVEIFAYENLIIALIIYVVLSILKNKFLSKNQDNSKHSVVEKENNTNEIKTSKLKLYFTSFLLSVVLSFIIFFILTGNLDNYSDGSQIGIGDTMVPFIFAQLIFALMISVIVFPIRLFNQKRKFKNKQFNK